LGGLILQEKDGPLNSYCINGSYAYFVPLNRSNTELSFGISTQLLYYTVDQSILNPLDQNDPELLKLNDSHLIPESGCGIYYHDSQFYFGTSINDLLLSKRPFNNDKIAPNKRDYFVQTGYKFFLRYFDLEPMIYSAKIDNNPLYYYSQLKLYYMNVNWLGLGYKSTKSFLVSIGMSINRVYIAYVFEHSTSEMGTYFNGSHELMLGINIGLYEPEGLRKRAGSFL
jgi:type IX secretion system PorP/SprF family membrane protein